jgi:hypothetical protein
VELLELSVVYCVVCCVCGGGLSPPYIGARTCGLRGIFPGSTPHCQPLSWLLSAHGGGAQLAGWRARPRPRRARLGWLSPPPPSPGCLSAGPGSAWVGGLVWLWSWVWASPLLWLFCAFQKAYFCFCFNCSRLLFLQSYHFYRYKWKHVNSTCIYVYKCIFPAFWNYVGGINMSIMTDNNEDETERRRRSGQRGWGRGWRRVIERRMTREQSCSIYIARPFSPGLGYQPGLKVF